MGNVLSRCANEFSNVFRSCGSQKADEERKWVKGSSRSQPQDVDDVCEQQKHDKMGEDISEVDSMVLVYRDGTTPNRADVDCLPECDQNRTCSLSAHHISRRQDKVLKEEPKISKEYIIQTYKITSHSPAMEKESEGCKGIKSQQHGDGNSESDCNGREVYQPHKGENIDAKGVNQLKSWRPVDGEENYLPVESEIKPQQQLQAETTFIPKESEKSLNPKETVIQTDSHKTFCAQTHSIQRAAANFQKNMAECVTSITTGMIEEYNTYLFDSAGADFTESQRGSILAICSDHQREDIAEKKQKQVSRAANSCENGSDLTAICSCTSAVQSGGEEQVPDRVNKLQQRQETILQELQKLQQSVLSLARQRGVSLDTVVPQSTSVGTTASVAQSAPLQDGVLRDLVISANPSNVPLSLLVLLKQLSKQYQVLTSTFVHSSAIDTPQNLRSFLQNGAAAGARSNYQLSISIVWKKIPNSPRMMVSPTCQSHIEGEANIARYLSRLLQPAYDSGDIVTATQIDEILDMAQQQIFQGNNKERSAALRTLNARLGKGQWLVGSSLSVADIVSWSAVHGAKLATDAPANVKKWLKLCAECQEFEEAVKFLSS